MPLDIRDAYYGTLLRPGQYTIKVPLAGQPGVGKTALVNTITVRVDCICLSVRFTWLSINREASSIPSQGPEAWMWYVFPAVYRTHADTNVFRCYITQKMYQH